MMKCCMRIALGLCLVLLLAPTASAEESWERAVPAARDKPDRAIPDAKRLQNVGRLIKLYQSHLSRPRTVPYL